MGTIAYCDRTKPGSGYSDKRTYNKNLISEQRGDISLRSNKYRTEEWQLDWNLVLIKLYQALKPYTLLDGIPWDVSNVPGSLGFFLKLLSKKFVKYNY